MARPRSNRRWRSCSIAIRQLGYNELRDNVEKRLRVQLSREERAGECATRQALVAVLAHGGADCAQLAPIAIGDRIAPVAPEGATAHPHAGRRLAALVFGTLHHIEHARDHRAIETALADLLDRQVVLDERLEDRIEHLVRRQRIGVLLIVPQLRGGLALDDALRESPARA